MKKNILLLLASTCLLASCNNVTQSSESKGVYSGDFGSASSGDIQGDSTSSSDSTSVDDDVDNTPLEDLSDISSGISVSTSGFLNDISIGMSLANHSSYPITFSLTNNPTGKVVVRSDNENVLTAEVSASGTSWTLNTHKQGKAHLIIEDGDGIAHYRTLVTVKKKLTAEEVTASLVEEDFFSTIPGFESATGDLTMWFVEGGTGYIYGTESGGVTLNRESFTYAWNQEYTSIAEDSAYWYVYKVSNWNVSDFVFDYFAVWNTGDRLHAHTRNGLLGILEPSAEI